MIRRLDRRDGTIEERLHETCAPLLGLLDDVSSVGLFALGACDEDTHVLLAGFGVDVLICVWGTAVSCEFVALICSFPLVPFANLGFEPG